MTMRVGIRLIAVFIAWCGVGCATSVDIDFDDRVDFSRYDSWKWLPRHGAAVQAPHRDERALEALLTRFVGQQLVDRGFERRDERPDLFVTYELVVTRREVQVPSATYVLSSLHSSPSYIIEDSGTAQTAEDVYLVIVLLDARGQPIWSGTLLRYGDAGLRSSVEDAAETLCARLPHRGEF